MTKLIDFLDKQYDHAYEMVKFGEAKNTTLAAFNGAIIIGIAQILKDVDYCPFKYYLQYAIIMCVISIFISFSALIAKIKHAPNIRRGYPNTNLMYFATLANLDHQGLIAKLTNEYGCLSDNQKYEEDVARQVIITSQIANRKFHYFNIGMSFTFAGLLTPLILIVYKMFLDQDK